MLPSTAHQVAQNDYPIPDDYVEDLVIGHGRVAQPWRRMTVRFEAITEDGRPIGQGEAQFLFPPLSRVTESGQPISSTYDSGSIPEWVGSALSGMRVGGTRRISLKAAPATKPGHPQRYSRGALVEDLVDIGIGDARTHKIALQIPRDTSGYLVATMIDVCRPHFKIWQTPKIIDVGIVNSLSVGSCE